MTKKHYIAIAEILKTFNTGLISNLCIKPMAKQFAEYFQQDNPRFDRERFLEACGVEQVCTATGEDCAIWTQPKTKDQACLDCGKTT